MSRLDRILLAIEGLMGWIGKAALFVMMIAVVCDAGGRYLANRPVPGIYEITELYLMIAVVFLGLGLSQRSGAHVRVELLLEHLPPAVQRALEFIYLLATLAVFAVVTYAAARTSYQNFLFNRWISGAVPIPTGPSWAIAALGSAVFCLRLAFQLVSLCFSTAPVRQQAEH
ncbi:TRAP transporter small permease [Rhodoligotrophos ferricapiens]|uniref:TRAP transporter small permease n=1 Tax=Rhodoligotrophos ferricapiens TaxID=3069264 RepID=UPI00315C5830